MADLRVELYGYLVGHLRGTDWRSFDFRTAREAFDRFELGSTVLSESVPLDVVPNRSRAQRRRNFFGELLPEGRVLTRLATAINVREHDVVPLLAAYGRDVAGAVQIYDPDRPGEPVSPHATPLGDDGVGRLLRGIQAQPLGNAPVTGKSSLAGVQEKVVVARLDGAWHQVHDGYPSTHIIKLTPPEHPTLIFDEEYGTRIARLLGLTDRPAWLADFDGVPGLVIERYDRSDGGRIHQEDFNQVLGARGDQKYQAIGGRVSLRRIARVFAARGDGAGLGRLLDQLTVAVAVGNLDWHAKNVSLLHPLDDPAELAPVYDVVPLRHQPNDGAMALAVNGRYAHASLAADDIAAEGRSWGVRDAGTRVLDLLERVRAVAAEEEPDERAHPVVAGQIRGFVANLLGGRPAG